MSDLAFKSWANGGNYMAHSLNLLLESLYAVTLLSTMAAPALSLAQEATLYLALKQHNIAPHPVVFGLFCAANILAPHALLAYMRKVQQRRGAVQGSLTMLEKTGKGPAAAADQGRGGDQTDDGAAAADEKQTQLEAKQRDAQEDLAAILQAQQQQQQAQATREGQQQGEGQAVEQSLQPAPTQVGIWMGWAVLSCNVCQAINITSLCRLPHNMLRITCPFICRL
jgi:hypothetical protein